MAAGDWAKEAEEGCVDWVGAMSDVVGAGSSLERLGQGVDSCDNLIVVFAGQVTETASLHAVGGNVWAAFRVFGSGKFFTIDTSNGSKAKIIILARLSKGADEAGGQDKQE